MALIKEIYPVEGMSCASCALSIQTILSAQEGVKSANVNLASEQVTIEYEPQQQQHRSPRTENKCRI